MAWGVGSSRGFARSGGGGWHGGSLVTRYGTRGGSSRTGCTYGSGILENCERQKKIAWASAMVRAAAGCGFFFPKVSAWTFFFTSPFVLSILST